MNIQRGDFYEDCGYHPRLCTEVNGDDLTGISLITGEEGNCSFKHCGVIKLTAEEAIIAWKKIREPE